MCAINFSDASKVAAERATEITRFYDAALTLLYAVENFPGDRSNEDIAPEDADPMAYREKKARAALAELGNHLAYEPLVQEVRFSTSLARQELACFAEEHNTDLVVVASYGQHGVTSILGPTAYRVTYSASCDVLVVRAHV